MSKRTHQTVKRAQVVSKALRAATITAMIGFGASVDAAPLYWDSNGITGGTSNVGGTWGTDAFWTSNSAGTTATGAWVTDSTAVFSAGTNGGTFTVSVSGTQQADGLTFEEGTLTLQAAGGGGDITLSGATPTITVGSGTANRNVRINAPITAANEVTLVRGTSGTATLHLGSANAFGNGIKLAGGIRVNANVNGALGTGTFTVTESNGTIANENAAGTSDNSTMANNIVLAPATPAAGWLFSVGAGKPTSTMDFTGNISGTGDLVLSADGNSLNSNGNGITVLSGNN